MHRPCRLDDRYLLGARTIGMTIMRLLYVTLGNPHRRSTQNNGFYIGQALAAAYPSVTMMESPKPRRGQKALLGSVQLLARRAHRVFMPDLEPWVVAHGADQIVNTARRSGSDLVISHASIPVGGLGTRVPYAYFNDAPVVGLTEVGGYLDDWTRRSLKTFIALDRQAVLHATAVFYFSQWAADLAIRHYAADPARLHVIPPGANLDPVPPADATVEKPCGAFCRLLFLGRDWARKGGSFAYATMEELARLGVPCSLTVCGPSTLRSDLLNDPRVHLVGPLDKDDPADYRQLVTTLQSTDYLLLPTRGDISPGAIREACAFAVPSVTTDIGGIAETIKSDVEGIVLSLTASPAQFAARIRDNYRDDPARLAMRAAARQAYEQRLNWLAATAQAKQILSSLS
jgi:glycosyltransferase involved in cell wall biosynthesis